MKTTLVWHMIWGKIGAKRLDGRQIQPDWNEVASRCLKYLLSTPDLPLYVVFSQLYSLIGWGCVRRSACGAIGPRRRPPAPGSARGAPGSREFGKTCHPPAEGPRWSRCRAVWEDACSPGGEKSPVNQEVIESKVLFFFLDKFCCFFLRKSPF